MVRRTLQAIVVIAGVMLVVFVLAHIVPGGEARAVLGIRAKPAEIASFNRRNGLNLPFWNQLWDYVEGLIVHQNLGYSYPRNEGVSTLIGEYLPKTLLLVGMATLVALVVAIPLGVLQAVRRSRPLDHAVTGLSYIFYATPSFFLGTLLILLFAIDLPWFSEEAPQGQSVVAILSDPRGLILPVVTLAAVTIALFSRYVRSSTMETLTEDYIRTARAYGIGPRRLIYRHALRNSLIPIVTLLGLSFPAIVGGAIIVESLFNYPGMGLLTYSAATQLDIPTLLGITFVVAVATVVGSLLADIGYALLDPRIRYERT